MVQIQIFAVITVNLLTLYLLFLMKKRSSFSDLWIILNISAYSFWFVVPAVGRAFFSPILPWVVQDDIEEFFSLVLIENLTILCAYLLIHKLSRFGPPKKRLHVIKFESDILVLMLALSLLLL